MELASGLVLLLALCSYFGFRYFLSQPKFGGATEVAAPGQVTKPYWQMAETEQVLFIKVRARYVQKLIGDEAIELDDEAVKIIKLELDDYVRRHGSLSQKPLEEGLRIIYGRASQYAPLVTRAYEARQIPPASGLYQAMIESEYRDCPAAPFQGGGR